MALIERGIAKGGLKYPEDAWLHLGEARVFAGHVEKAIAPFVKWTERHCNGPRPIVADPSQGEAVAGTEQSDVWMRSPNGQSVSHNLRQPAQWAARLFCGLLLLAAMSGCATPMTSESPVMSSPLEAGTPAAPSVAPTVSASDSGERDERRSAAVTQPAPVAADDIPMIHVIATGLSGFWAVTASSSIDLEVGLLTGVRIRYSGTAYDRDICRIRYHGDALRAICVAGFTPTAEGSLDGDRIALRWWAGPATVIFQGNWDGAATINGALSGGMVGLSITGEIPATLHKVQPQAAGLGDHSSATMIGAVLDDLRRGSLTDGRYEPMANKRLQPAFSWAGAKEPSHSLVHLGQIHIRWHRWQNETIQDVYDVQSPSDHALCRIALSERGRVVDFACQSGAD